MLGFERIVGFDWDDANSRKSDEKHGVTQAEAEQVFLNEPLLIVDDVEHSQSEARFHALGRTTVGRRLHVTFTIRGTGTLIRVISARHMSRQERARYAQET
jgi:uncharacterized DUF497 family protein